MDQLFWTPHSGYHWDGAPGRFFEGWYCRLTLPAVAQSFAFMYSIDDPAGASILDSSSTPDLSGGAAQILGPDETYLYCPFPNVAGFWAWRGHLGLGHWGQVAGSGTVVYPPRYLEADRFRAGVSQGYQLTATHHQGQVQDPQTGLQARWDYTVVPRYGWGGDHEPPRPTAGWLSYLPIFEPGWQVLMAHGWGTGWIEWGRDRYDFHQAPVYCEKNWGHAFPEKWFWIQCNAFADEPDLSLTMAGARRQVLTHQETVGLVGLHYRGQFFELSSLRGQIQWQVTPWGDWWVSALTHRYRLELRGTCDATPAQVRVPTREGLQFRCWDTTHGHLTVSLWARSPAGRDCPFQESLILQAESTLAGLEVGGHDWQHPWQYSG